MRLTLCLTAILALSACEMSSLGGIGGSGGYGTSVGNGTSTGPLADATAPGIGGGLGQLGAAALLGGALRPDARGVLAPVMPACLGATSGIAPSPAQMAAQGFMPVASNGGSGYRYDLSGGAIGAMANTFVLMNANPAERNCSLTVRGGGFGGLSSTAVLQALMAQAGFAVAGGGAGGSASDALFTRNGQRVAVAGDTSANASTFTFRGLP
ncbi:hypothetical protein [uncultured Maritimibacter sp.]|jgi:hypothetical protein|uniref:hypothetical protein n=1 Tax=uncultured Maritimibacter sp. TaxID=991866 RepID=UPI000AC4C672|nr:hypothetical protein [uncultured Maritimibacter sp.]